MSLMDRYPPPDGFVWQHIVPGQIKLLGLTPDGPVCFGVVKKLTDSEIAHERIRRRGLYRVAAQKLSILDTRKRFVNTFGF